MNVDRDGPRARSGRRRMTLLIVGAGGVGGYFGARLARAGEAVTLLARGPHLDAIRAHGLRVRSAVDGEYVTRPEAVADVRGRPAAATVLLCVKAFDTAAALAVARPVVGPETAVVSLQNGVESLELIDHALGSGHAVGGVAYVFAAIEAPGVIRHRLHGRIVFGELDGRRSERAEAILRTFTAAGVPVELTSDIRRILWEKYLFISAQAGMTALTRLPIGVIRDTAASWQMYRAILGELAALARAAGVPLAADVTEAMMKAAATLDPGAFSSLHHDLVHGRRLELEALHGHAVRLAGRLGVPVPTVFAVYAVLKPHEGGRGGGSSG